MNFRYFLQVVKSNIPLLFLLLLLFVSTTSAPPVIVIESEIRENTMRLISLTDYYIPTSSNMTASTDQIIWYFFNFKPLQNGLYTILENIEEIITDGSYVYFYDFFPAGSVVNVNWNSSGDLDYYVIKGSQNFNSWETGMSTELRSALNKSNALDTLNVDNDDFYYFAFENLNNNSVSVDIAFEQNYPKFILEQYLSSSNGSFDGVPDETEYIVVHNTSNSTESFSIQYGSGTTPVSREQTIVNRRTTERTLPIYDLQSFLPILLLIPIVNRKKVNEKNDP